MKILVISSPFLPVTNGYGKCLLECCIAMKERGCELYYLSPYPCLISDEIKDFFSLTFQYKQSSFNRFHPLKIIHRIEHIFCKYDRVDNLYPWGMENYVNKLNSKYSFDACIINYITLSRLFKKCKIPRRITFTYKNEILSVPQFWFMLKPSEEAKGIRRGTDVLAVQQDEKTLFQYYHPKGKHYTIFCRMPINSQSLTFNNNVLFLAGNNKLNLNGIIFFLNYVLPLVQAKTSVTILIGGSICKELNQYANNPSIKLLGPIDDINEFYANGDIAINPIYQGTGLKIKTMEALSYGKVTIVHNHSIKGIYKSESAPLMVANTAEEYSDLVVKALDDYQLRKELSLRSLSYIKEMNNYVDKEYSLLLGDEQ